jgi:trehalose 6-phosphate synthase/phosphatase
MDTESIQPDWQKELLDDYSSASKRSILLDYDGTLAPFVDDPRMAIPTDRLKQQLSQLSNRDKNEVVIISGRNKEDIGEWFKDVPITLVVEHGGFVRQSNQEAWVSTGEFDTSWKPAVNDIFEHYVANIPGSFIETKENSMVWHYRKSDPILAQENIEQLKSSLVSIAQDFNLKVELGSMTVEVRPIGIDKGKTATEYSQDADFILAIGDDTTDEAMFEALPSKAWTIKVRLGKTAARFCVSDVQDVHSLLEKLNDQD